MPWPVIIGIGLIVTGFILFTITAFYLMLGAALNESEEELD